MLKRGDSGFLEELRKQLYTAVLSDVLDETGFRDQAMAARVRPLDDELVMAGFARTGLFREVFHVAEGENPYELEIRIIDDLKSGEIVVFGCGGSERIAPWGELLTTAARARGAVGAVTDGFVRDVRAIRNAGFSVFHGGIAPLDPKLTPLVEGQRRVADPDKRHELERQACAYIADQCWNLALFRDVTYTVTHPNVQGLRIIWSGASSDWAKNTWLER